MKNKLREMYIKINLNKILLLCFFVQEIAISIIDNIYAVIFS